MADRAGEQSGDHRLIHLLVHANTAQPAEVEYALKNNLPAQLTSLIGREQEVMAVRALLRQPELRLLTLTGTGGIGKTRLGLQVAKELLDEFVDGVYFVPLAPIADPSLVLPTIAKTLGINEDGERPFQSFLQAYLREKHLLLLLDNFEQVTAAAPELANLLSGCPDLKVMVTSRAVLHLHGEHEFPVPPLALPDLQHFAQRPESEALSKYPAIHLFLQRASAIKPGFVLTEANAHVVAEICARLDGLPLAIELAAARIKLLSPRALLQRLSRRFEVLTSRTQNAPERQQTLRNALAWSYDLLNVQEQRIFRRLSIFAGGCTLEAIEYLCSALGDDCEEGVVLDGVASLIDKSLMQSTEQEVNGEEETRFAMLETVREYGLEALAASGEMEVIQQAHAAYHLRLAEEAEQELGGPQQATWLKRLEQEHDNLRAAQGWLLERGEAEEGGQHKEMALRLGGALRRFWVIHGHISEGRHFLERALAGSEGVKASVRAKALVAAANLAVIQSDYSRAELLAAESLAQFRELGDQAGIALSLYLLGSAAWTRGYTGATRSLIEEALVLSRAVGDKERVAWSLFTLALLDRGQGEYARARVLFEECLAMHREVGSKRGMASSLSQLAQVLFVSRGDLAMVNSLLEEGLALFRELGDKEGIAASLCLAGQVALSQGDIAAARTLAEESVLLYREIGYQWSMTSALSFLARVAAFQGNAMEARNLYEESLALGREADYKESIASSLEGLAEVVVAQGEPAWAAQLWGAAESLRSTAGVPMPPVERDGYERAVAAVRAQLGEGSFAVKWAEGRAMTPEQALAALGETIVLPPAATRVSAPSYPAGLTAREVDVMRLVARGLSNAQIARELVLSEKTVAAHLTHIFNKTDSENRAAAAAFAIRNGLV